MLATDVSSVVRSRERVDKIFISELSFRKFYMGNRDMNLPQ